MMNYEEIIRLRRQAAQRDFEASLIPGMTGAWVNGTLVASDDAGTIFVRMGAVTQDDLRPAVKATNAVVDTDVNIPVFLWYVNGVLDIYSINSQLAKEKFGAAVGNKATPRRAGDLSQEWVTGRNLKPGRVYIRAGALEAGMMEVTAGEFDYIDTNGDPKKWRSFPDSAALDISGSEPGSGEGRWVRITFDPDATSPTLVANDGTAMLPELLTPENANDIAIPDGHLTLDFYKYLEGDTPYNLADESRWLFGRHLFNGGSGGGAISVTDGTTTVNPATAMEFDGNFVVTDAGGGIAQIAGPSGGATILGDEELWYHEITGSAGIFDTSVADDLGRTIASLALYHEVWFEGQIRSTVAAASDIAYMFFNTATTASDYRSQYDAGYNTIEEANAGDTPRIGGTNGASSTTGDFGHIWGRIADPSNTTKRKTVVGLSFRSNDNTNPVAENWGFTWESTAAITRIRLQPDGYATDNFVVGSWLRIVGKRKVSVGAADLDVGSVGSITAVRADKVVLGDVSNSDNTGVDTIEDVLKLASDTLTSTATGNVDNLAIGNAPIVHVRFNNASTVTLRGIAGSGVDGQICVVDSVGAGNVLLAHQNSGSTAANRLINYVTGMDTPLAAALGRAVFVYDATTQRWKMVSHNQGAAITYTPTWTSTGTNPTLGNSTLTGNYLINGNLIMGDFTFTYGSSGVSSGTGVWLFSLPTAVSLQGGGGSANDAGVAGYSVTAARNSSTTVALSAAAAQVTGNNPFTWGSTDNIRLAWFGVAT